jgi:chloride channel 3/4/5
MIRTTKLMEDYSSDEEPPPSPTYGSVGRTTASRRQRNGTINADTPFEQKTVNLDDSDVDMLTVSGGSDPHAGSLNRATSSRQPIVHFEGGVREPIGPRDIRDIEYSPRVNEKKYYDDFHTIDWVRDRNRDRLRHKRLNRDGRLSWRGCTLKMWDAGSGWLIVFLVGVSSGLLAGMIDVATEWMSDLKEGWCPSAGYYNRESCCWINNDTNLNMIEEHCSLWHTWGAYAGVSGDVNEYVVDYIIYVSVAVVFAGLAGLFVTTLAPYAAGSGIPEVKTILSGFIIRGYLGAWTLLVKSLGMVLAVGAGLTLGKEGPLVHVACCCGNLFTRLFPKYYNNEAKKREVLSAAAAAGVSVAFGAPVGGVLFSLEEISYYFPHKVMWRAFFAALTAAFTLQLMNPYFSGHLVLFYANYDHQWHLFEFIPFILLGLFGGLYGAMFIKLNLLWVKFKRRKFNRFPIPLFEVLLVALLTGIISFPNPYTRTNASEVIRTLFSRCGPEDNNDLCHYNTSAVNPLHQYHDTRALEGVWRAMWQVGLAMFAKAVLCIFTFGIKVPAGLFIPSMFVGACMGRILGVCMEQFAYTFRDSEFFQLFCSPNESCVTPGLYAMIGAAATLGGVTRMTGENERERSNDVFAFVLVACFT